MSFAGPRSGPRKVALLAVAALVASTLAAFPSSAVAAPTRPMLAVSFPNQFPGSYMFNMGDPEGFERQLRARRSAFLRTAKSVGATHIRVWVMWDEFHSCNPTLRDMNMQLLLSGIQQARAAGLKPIISFGAYASSSGKPLCDDPRALVATGFNPSGKAYANFVSYVARHVVRDPYRVRLFASYNEPDIRLFMCVMDTSKPIGGGQRTPVNVEFNGDGPVGTYVRNGQTRQASCGYRRSAKRARYLHKMTVGAITTQLADIGVPRSMAKIAFGLTTAGGKPWFRHALHTRRNIDADAVGVNAYWHKRTGDPAEKISTRCDAGIKATPNYIGVECVRRLRALLDEPREDGSEGPLHGKPIWSTEGGLDPGSQLADGSNAAAMMNQTWKAGASMVTWYHVLFDPTTAGSWNSSLTDLAGGPSNGGNAIRSWAGSVGLPVAPGGWLPAEAPGAVPCEGQAPGTPNPPASVECSMPAPPAPTPPVEPNSWVVHPGTAAEWY